MKLNKDCALFLQDIYSYDIVSCHPTILQKLGFDISNIINKNKLKKNIEIGMLMKDNPRLIHLLRNITESTISEYIRRNNLKDEEIILKQYDGIFVTKLLKEKQDKYISIELRSIFNKIIITPDRMKYIALNKNNKVIIKGLSFRYHEIDNIFSKIIKLNFISKKSLFLNLDKIKSDILYSDNPMLFLIPVKEDKFNIFLKKYGEITITDNMINFINTSDIDKQKYFDFYIKPFYQSLVIEFS